MIKLIRILVLLCVVSTTLYNSLAEEVINDPMTPVVKDPSSLRIQGVSGGDDKLFCIINNKIYQEGDKIFAFTITKIELEKIFFQDKDGKITEITF